MTAAAQPPPPQADLLMHWRQFILPEQWEDLCTRYGEPHRVYHTLEHVGTMLQLLSWAGNRITDKLAVALAIIYHDAVYDVTRKDNEEKSAELAIQHLSRNPAIAPATIAAVAALIMATKHGGAPQSPDAAYLADMDLAVLGSESAAYAHYATAIRREYSACSDPDYRAGRAQFLQEHFLNRPFIFATPLFRDTFEQQARKNITAEIALLRH